jgi:hypothetical protein
VVLFTAHPALSTTEVSAIPSLARYRESAALLSDPYFARPASRRRCTTPPWRSHPSQEMHGDHSRPLHRFSALRSNFFNVRHNRTSVLLVLPAPFRHCYTSEVKGVSDYPCPNNPRFVFPPENVGCTRFPGFERCLVFEIPQNGWGAPGAVTGRTRIFSYRATLPYAYRVGFSERERSGPGCRGVGEDCKYGKQRQE